MEPGVWSAIWWYSSSLRHKVVRATTSLLLQLLRRAHNTKVVMRFRSIAERQLIGLKRMEAPISRPPRFSISSFACGRCNDTNVLYLRTVAFQPYFSNLCGFNKFWLRRSSPSNIVLFETSSAQTQGFTRRYFSPCAQPVHARSLTSNPSEKNLALFSSLSYHE
jgi:hypothetical protein